MLDNTSKICPLFEDDDATEEVQLGAMYNSIDFDAASLMKFKKQSLTFTREVKTRISIWLLSRKI